MTDGKAEYLQLLQKPISRMSTISVIFKGFAATIVAGISMISYATTNLYVLELSFLPVLAFAASDIYYLRLEKQFRFLYKQVQTDTHEIDFSIFRQTLAQILFKQKREYRTV